MFKGCGKVLFQSKNLQTGEMSDVICGKHHSQNWDGSNRQILLCQDCKNKKAFCKYCGTELEEFFRGGRNLDDVYYWCPNEKDCKLEYWDRVIHDSELEDEEDEY